jgi:hypothetical protein
VLPASAPYVAGYKAIGIQRRRRSSGLIIHPSTKVREVAAASMGSEFSREEDSEVEQNVLCVGLGEKHIASEFRHESTPHTRIVLSVEPDTMRFPSGEIATD